MTTKKKKKMKKNEVQVPFPVVLANLLVLVAVLGLSYMWLCSRCDALGEEIKTRESQLKKTEKTLDIESGRWSAMTAPNNIRNAILNHKLDMSIRPEHENVRVVYDHRTTTASLSYLK